jgi:hypothetical protein
MHRLILLFSLMFVGCATRASREYSVPTKGHQYAISFHQSSSREFGDRCFYSINGRQLGTVIGRVPSQIKVDERGVDDRPLRGGRDFKPSAVSNASGSCIIITEDCWDVVPFDTYLVIRISNHKITSSVYRNVPRHSPSLVPIYGYLGVVDSLTEHEVRVSYGDGTSKTFVIDSLPLLTAETPRS